MSSAERLRSPISRPTERVKSGMRLGPRTIKMIAKIMISSGKPILNIIDIISKINYSDNTNPLSIYVHIPFCKSKCIYCDFNSYAIKPSEDYFKAILNDVEFFGNLIKRQFKSIYIGGGTPSIVSPNLIEMILSKIFKSLNIEKNAEITIEVNPESLSLSKAKIYKKSGINRISVGIQSFNEQYLKALGRSGCVEDNVKALRVLERAGFNNISADLMFGLPGQNLNDWRMDLKTLTEFEPGHVSAYMLTPPPHMVRNTLQDDELCTEMLLECIGFLEKKGLRQYEISNYAIPGYECIHNLNYWNRGEFIGFGAGAHSFLKGKNNGNLGVRWWNKKSPLEFASATPETRVEGFEYIDSEKALVEIIMLGMRKRDGIRISEIEKFIKLDKNSFSTRLKEIIDKKLLYYDGNILKLTTGGIPVANSVIVNVLEAIIG